MSNMSYCRWENTLNDLRDCIEHIEDDLSESENRARGKIIDLMNKTTKEIAMGDIEVGGVDGD